MNFTQEAVQEFKVFRNQFDAEYGGALSAEVSVLSKSGRMRSRAAASTSAAIGG
jgi:hypothetical protein